MVETTQKITFIEFLHKNLVWVLAFVGFILWYTKKPEAAQGRLISSDTTRTQVLQPIVVNAPSQPTQAGNTVYIPTPQQYQSITPASTIEALIQQVLERNRVVDSLAREFYAKKNYRDSITLKDTAGRRVGVVNLNQYISENTLKSTQSSYQLLFPNTLITNTVQAKIKNQVLLGGSVQSPIGQPGIGQIDAGLIFRNRRENELSFSATYDHTQPIQQRMGIRVGYYQKLSFKPLIKLPIP